MTNKEAIRILSNMIHDDKVLYGDKPKPNIEALDLAIEALKEKDLREKMKKMYYQELRKEICND